MKIVEIPKIDLEDLNSILMKLELEDYEYGGTYGFPDVWDYISFNYARYAKDDESLEEYAAREWDDIKRVDGIILKALVPLDLIEQCEKDMGYNPFSEFI